MSTNRTGSGDAPVQPGMHHHPPDALPGSDCRPTRGDGGAPGPQEGAEEILRLRARALAKRVERADFDDARIEVIEFVTAGERYAFESQYVREVYPVKRLTPVPCTPAFVLGILNLRGRIISVIDIRIRLGFPQKEHPDLGKIIVIQTNEMEVGVMVDTLLGVRAVGTRDLQPAFSTLMGVREEYLKGITSDRLLVLDAGNILAEKGLVVLEERSS
ncbi:MAG: chemotaxis protein CheW [Candidatus Krumholzibacteriia bacterium]